jgi:hypothetical protein
MKHNFVGAKHPEITGYQEPTCTQCGIRQNHPFSNEPCGGKRK